MEKYKKADDGYLEKNSPYYDLDLIKAFKIGRCSKSILLYKSFVEKLS